jgi:hypothetical protein
MNIIVFLALSSTIGSPMPLCGLNTHAKRIQETKNLVISKFDLVIPITEMPTKTGTPACTRLSFFIDKFGRATSVKVADSSNNFIMNVSAYRALKKYKFRSPTIDDEKKYTLVFSGIIDRQP